MLSRSSQSWEERLVSAQGALFSHQRPKGAHKQLPGFAVWNMGSNRATNTVSPSSPVLDPFPVADLGAGEISKSFSISPARHALKAAGGFVCLFLIVFFSH